VTVEALGAQFEQQRRKVDFDTDELIVQQLIAWSNPVSSSVPSSKAWRP
jgi:hypothetical protein